MMSKKDFNLKNLKTLALLDYSEVSNNRGVLIHVGRKNPKSNL